MNIKKFSQQSFAFGLVFLLVVGCSAPATPDLPTFTSTPIPPAFTSTAIPPTSTSTAIPPTLEPSPAAGLDAEIPLYEGASPLESGKNSTLDQAAQAIIDTVMSQVKTEPNVETQINIFTLPAEVTGQDIFKFYIKEMPLKGWQTAQFGVMSDIQFFNFSKENGNKTSFFATKDASAETDDMALMIILVFTK